MVTDNNRDNNDDSGNGNNFDLVDVDGGNGKW